MHNCTMLAPLARCPLFYVQSDRPPCGGKSLWKNESHSPLPPGVRHHTISPACRSRPRSRCTRPRAQLLSLAAANLRPRQCRPEEEGGGSAGLVSPLSSRRTSPSPAVLPPELPPFGPPQPLNRPPQALPQRHLRRPPERRSRGVDPGERAPDVPRAGRLPQDHRLPQRQSTHGRVASESKREGHATTRHLQASNRTVGLL